MELCKNQPSPPQVRAALWLLPVLLALRAGSFYILGQLCLLTLNSLFNPRPSLDQAFFLAKSKRSSSPSLAPASSAALAFGGCALIFTLLFPFPSGPSVLRIPPTHTPRPWLLCLRPHQSSPGAKPKPDSGWAPADQQPLPGTETHSHKEFLLHHKELHGRDAAETLVNCQEEEHPGSAVRGREKSNADKQA